MLCRKCKTRSDDCVKCERCPKALCRKCDNTSTELAWEELKGIEEPDEYLCRKCFKKAKEGCAGLPQPELQQEKSVGTT